MHKLYIKSDESQVIESVLQNHAIFFTNKLDKVLNISRTQDNLILIDIICKHPTKLVKNLATLFSLEYPSQTIDIIYDAHVLTFTISVHKTKIERLKMV